MARKSAAQKAKTKAAARLSQSNSTTIMDSVIPNTIMDSMISKISQAALSDPIIPTGTVPALSAWKSPFPSSTSTGTPEQSWDPCAPSQSAWKSPSSLGTSSETSEQGWDRSAPITSAWESPSSLCTSSETSEQSWDLPPTAWNTVEPTVEKLRVVLIPDWPWGGDPLKIKTDAPWAHSALPWDLPRVDNLSQSPLFSVLFANDLVRQRILGIVFASREMTDVFPLLCQDSFNVGSWFIQHWDMTHGGFHNCEIPVYKPYEIEENPKLTNDTPTGTGIKLAVIVTPIRTQNGPAPYATQIVNLYKMTIASRNFALMLQNLQFHRVPLLTMHLLKLIIPKCTMLTYLGVYNCQAIHVGKTKELLEIMNLQADNRVTRRQLLHPRDPVKKIMCLLDFYPRFHDAKLIGKAGLSSERTHAYGCTWDSWDGDSRQAIWAIVYGATRYIRKIKLTNGLYFLAPGSAFRKWLKKSPVFDVDFILDIMLASKVDLAELTVWVLYHKFKGNLRYLTKHNDSAHLVLYPTTPNWWTEHFKCGGCDIDLPKFFLHFRQIQASRSTNGRDKCRGCIMTAYMDGEEDHYKKRKLGIIGAWLKSEKKDDSGKRWLIHTEISLERTIQLFDERRVKIVRMATNLDNRREQDIMSAANGGLQYDHELHERQMPVDEKASTFRHGRKGLGLSPTCDEDKVYACYKPRNVSEAW